MQNVEFSYIPSSLSYDGKVHFISGTPSSSQSSFNIYDDNLKVIKTINTNRWIYKVSFHDADYATGVDGDGEVDTYLSQTLFNNDSKYEYVVCQSGKCQIINEDGKVLQELSYPVSATGNDEPSIYVYKANGKFFMQFYVSYTNQQGEYAAVYYLYPINKNTTEGINPLG